MRRGHREQSMSASASSQRAEPDLFSMLLPNDHAHIPKGKSAMWERHYQHQQQAQIPPVTTPRRPQTSHRSSITSVPPYTSRQLVASPVKKLTLRCKSADPSNSPRRTKLVQARQPLAAQAPIESRLEDEAFQISGEHSATNERDSNQLSLKVDSREHVEIKACMLAHMHRIDVDALQQLREQANHEIDVITAKQLVARGGILDDGSLLQSTKRKTSFLLRHFFTLGEPSSTAPPSKQEIVLNDVIDEWSCHETASPDEISALWKSIVAHIESSYVLRRQLVPSTDPNALSITIAMDCLRKLPSKLPEYRRMLDVIIVLVESGLYLPAEEIVDGQDGSSHLGIVPSSRSATAKRTYYFDECQALRDALNRELDEKRIRLAAEAEVNAARTHTPREQLQSLLDALKSLSASGNTSATETEELFRLFFQANERRLLPVALREVLRVCYESDRVREEERRLFLETWMAFLQPDDAIEVLVHLATHHISAFQAFLHQEFDAMDKILMEPLASTTSTPPDAHSSCSMAASPVAITRRNSGIQQTVPYTPDSPATSLFHELIERHPVQFAAVLWSSPFLTAHVFQDSQHLIARILEQNIFSISHVLHQRPDVLTSLLNHTLKDNSNAIEEFLQTHPKALSDLLMNKAPSVSAAIKSYPSILVDILQSSRPTLAKVLLSMPELLCHLFKSTPDLLAQTIREDAAILPLAFSVVPQCLGDALERHPEYFVDVAHRKPALVAKIFAKYPDLLLEPLEANPSVFSNFLVFHRKILPDFSSPSFDPSFFQFERKQFEDIGQQTERRLCKYDGRLRIRERMKFQEDAQVCEIRQAQAAITATLTANGRSTPGGGNDRTTPGLPCERPPIKDGKGGLLAPSPGQVMSEVARIYMKKLDVDAQTDARGKKRRALVDFVLDLYIRELGFKSKAQKKLTLLLTGAKQAEQESLRIKWFLRFMNAGGLSSPIPASTNDTLELLWTYHPLASEFYRAATHFLMALPDDQLTHLLEEELSRPCLVGYTRVKQFIESPLVTRMLPAKDQRQQLLATICEKESLIHGAASETATAAKASSAVSVTALHLEDVLDSLMAIWIQFQDSIRSEWAIQFQLVNPDGSGVLRYNVFADLIRSKLPAMDERAIMKVYHQCGEENDLGEYFVSVDDFTLAMSIIQEQDAILKHAAQVVSTGMGTS